MHSSDAGTETSKRSRARSEARSCLESRAQKSKPFGICSPLLFFCRSSLFLSLNVTVAFFSCRRRRRRLFSFLSLATSEPKEKHQTHHAVRRAGLEARALVELEHALAARAGPEELCGCLSFFFLD